MNRERIIQLADHIKDLPHYKEGKYMEGDAFTMSQYRFSCDAPACIAGWAAKFSGLEFTGGIYGEVIHEAARDYFGISDNDADLLFSPTMRWEEITPRQAAATLYQFAETGTIDWEA